MGRKIGSKNKNTNTAKNKNIININVNTAPKKKRGRPSKNETNNNKSTRNQQLTGGGAYNTRAPVFTAPPPPVQYIAPPQPDPSNSLLQSFITSRLLNESTMQNRPSMSNMVSEEPSRRETLNFRESIIPKVEDTPIKANVKPPPPAAGPPPPPPPPPQKIKAKDVKPSTNAEFNSGGLTGQDAINAELKYRASEEGKAEMARKKAEKEAKKAEKEGKSMLDSMGVTFPSPFTPAPKTPQSKSRELMVRPVQQSMFDFVAGGGTPSKQYTKPTEEDIKKSTKIKRIKELNTKPDKTTKETLQYNDLRQELAGTPNENPTIASNAIKNAFKGKLARNEMKLNASIRQSEINAKKEAVQKDAASKLSGAFKTKLTKKFNEAKNELNVKNTGEPLVVDKNTKEMILKKNRDRGVKAAALRASKKTSAEQEKIIKFASFMVDENKRKPFKGQKQTEI
jgi:hypothetical protein